MLVGVHLIGDLHDVHNECMCSAVPTRMICGCMLFGQGLMWKHRTHADTAGSPEEKRGLVGPSCPVDHCYVGLFGPLVLGCSMMLSVL
jgi:hypothetical protein